MTTLEQQKGSVYTFIVTMFSLEVYDDLKEDESEVSGEFTSYQDFLDCQRQTIAGLDIEKLTFIRQLQSLITSGNVDIVEKDCAAVLDIDGFYFNRNGKLHITTPG